MSDHPSLIQTTDGPMVVMPADDDGDHELLTINQAHARLRDLLADDDCCGDGCLACDLAELLNGIR